MENIATLLCTRDETQLVQHVTRLAHLAGIVLKVDRQPSPGYWPGTALVLTSPQVRHLAPRHAVAVSLAGSGSKSDLVLPQDEEQVLALLSSKRPQAQVIGVRGLVSGVNTTVTAALLAQSCFEVAWSQEQITSKTSGAVDLENFTDSDWKNTVCLVDFSGSTLPLGAYLAPLHGTSWDWRQLLRPGLPAPFRLAAGLPRWGEVAVLSGSGFIPPSQLSQAQAVLRALTQAFRLVVVDFGMTVNPLDLAVAAQIWVGNCTRQTVLAWEDVVLHPSKAANKVPTYLMQESAGSLPVNQVNHALKATHLDIPVFRLANHPKDQKLWNQEGIYWPARKAVRREFEAIAHRVYQDLDAFQNQWPSLRITPHESAPTNTTGWQVEA